MFDLKGKVIWIVGASGYLGEAVCRHFAKMEASLVLSDMNEARLQELTDGLRNEGHQAISYPLHIGDEQAVIRCGESIMESQGKLDVMINLACFSTGKPMETMTANDFNKGVQINLTGAFLIGREAARHMKPAGSGSIIQFSSMYGIVSPDPGLYPPTQPINPIDYGTSKAGVLQLVRYQAMQLAPYNVRVNAIVPGTFPNPTTAGKDKAFIDNLTRRVPMKRVGTPKDILGPVTFLASEASRYMTGTSLIVDGGWTIS